MESVLVMNILKISITVGKFIETAHFYELAVKCLNVFNSEQKPDVEFIFKNIIFNPNFYSNDVLIQNLNLNEANCDASESSLYNVDDVFKVYSQILDFKNVSTYFNTILYTLCSKMY